MKKRLIAIGCIIMLVFSFVTTSFAYSYSARVNHSWGESVTSEDRYTAYAVVRLYRALSAAGDFSSSISDSKQTSAIGSTTCTLQSTKGVFGWGTRNISQHWSSANTTKSSLTKTYIPQ